MQMKFQLESATNLSSLDEAASTGVSANLDDDDDAAALHPLAIFKRQLETHNELVTELTWRESKRRAEFEDQVRARACVCVCVLVRAVCCASERRACVRFLFF
jgi:hypothetical protein